MVTQDARSGSSQVVCEKFLWGGGGGVGSAADICLRKL